MEKKVDEVKGYQFEEKPSEVMGAILRSAPNSKNLLNFVKLFSKCIGMQKLQEDVFFFELFGVIFSDFNL